ncbi:MAG TPA: TolC family protein [Gammaproteobacteria bacterium]|nr:TolC family protein [Gammaproteobacteria bacterium]
MLSHDLYGKIQQSPRADSRCTVHRRAASLQQSPCVDIENTDIRLCAQRRCYPQKISYIIIHHLIMWASSSTRIIHRCTLVALCLFSVGLLSANAARAQEGVKWVSASQAIRLALAHNPDSRAAEQNVVAARGGVEQAKVLPNPDIFVYTLGREIRPAQAPTPNQFGFTWTIPIGGKRAARIAIAKTGVSAARAGRLAMHRQLAMSVETAFVTVLLDRSMLEFAKQDQNTFRQSVKINEIRYKDGKISFGEVLKLRIQARQVDDAVREANQNLINERLELRRLVGEGVLAPHYQVVGSLDSPKMPQDPVVNTVLQQALQNRADYRALRDQQSSAWSALTLARRQIIPDIGVLADYNREPGTDGSYDLELTATMPLFDRNHGNIKRAQADYQKAGLAIDAFRAQIRADVARAVQQWRTSQQRLLAYNDDFVKTARESLDIARHSYEEGRGSLLDFLDAESSYRDVQRAYRTAEAGAVLAAANIKFVSGKDLQ